MKKLYDPLPAGGAPVFTETLNEVIQGEIWKALEGVLSTLDITTLYPLNYQQDPGSSGFEIGTGIIVAGGDFTDGGTGYTIAAGIAYFPQTKLFAEFTETVVTGTGNNIYISPGTASNTTKTFFDGSSKNYYTTQDCDKVVSGVTGATSGLSEWVRIEYAEEIGGKSLMGHPYLGNVFKMLALSTLDSSQIALTMNDNWTGSTSYRRVGRIGHLHIDATNSASATVDTIGTLPSTGLEHYRPLYNIVGFARGATSGTLYDVTINATSGDIVIVGASGVTETSIDGEITFMI
jgi:hypothetical protein